jgi:hypothetical protein
MMNAKQFSEEITGYLEKLQIAAESHPADFALVEEFPDWFEQLELIIGMEDYYDE